MVKILCNGTVAQESHGGVVQRLSDHEKRYFDPEECLLINYNLRRQRLFNKDRDAAI